MSLLKNDVRVVEVGVSLPTCFEELVPWPGPVLGCGSLSSILRPTLRWAA
ncbi:hypothetical protein GLAREA_04047 [Glarea lozoyensis ATCC 20868]|uniref:Uncharacterized protein n=1 Tax=Glarea lozoyensis (strain ATCC 20868 / MF5171) TaxID=1116229 RepID=S3CZN5_GLAL2|nr:uncharacterized protein GLAREA_04047 [Glarea lozoyensis ATCC 20868]EPE31080.1 hypothetical protein GLAREA_04047 [Glarea lozoyensis ATCC 20868]